MRPSADKGLEPFRTQDWNGPKQLTTESYAPSQHPPYYTPATRQRAGGKSTYISLGLQLLAFALSVAVLGLVANAVAVYKSSKDWKIMMGGGVILPGWHAPGEHFTTPMLSLLGSAATAVALGALALAFMAYSIVRKSGSSQPKLISISSFIVAILYIASLAYVRVRSTSSDLIGWSCDYRTMEDKHDSNSIGLGTVCTNIHVSWYLGLVALLANLGLCGMSAWTAFRKPKTTAVAFSSTGQRASYAQIKASKHIDGIPMLPRPSSSSA